MSSAWKRARTTLAGGVNSPVRAFKAVGGEPVFMAKGEGAYLTDIRGKRYIELCSSWGALLMGHAHPRTVAALKAQAARGTSFGTATEAETRLAQLIRDAFPSMQRIRMTSSGTEAVMSAIRLARGATGRERIVKFDGCYHGHADSLLVKAGSGLATFGIADSLGVPQPLAKLTSVLPYNDPDAARSFLRSHKDVAAVIVEPVAGNMGVVPAGIEFLETLRKETSRSGALLIFDEVISGFRVCLGGAQHVYGIRPDLTVLGKIIGGGLPVGAFGGRAELMEQLSPIGSVYQAGTLSGNPMSMAAGISVLSAISRPFYDKLDRASREFTERILRILVRKGRTVSMNRVGSMFTVFYSSRAPRNMSEVAAGDKKAFVRDFNALLKCGIYGPPSAFEASFLSAAHHGTVLDKACRLYEKI